MNLFYEPDINGQYVTLNKDDSGHLIRVLRGKTGDLLHLTDGKGFFYECKIIDPDPKKCLIEIKKKETGNDTWPFNLHIAIAPTKNISRFEWFLEKSTEIGINEITPLLCEHSERKVVKTDRLNRILVAAIKQSLKSNLPLLHEPASFKELINQPFDGQKFIAYVDEHVAHELFDVCRPKTDTLILIGPEGDFSEKEISKAINNGFTSVKLGPARLRTETAGIVACHTVHLSNF